MARHGVDGWSSQAFRRIRSQKNLTLDDLELLTGVRAGTLSKWENGIQTPTPRLLKRVAIQLDVEFGDLAPVAEERIRLHHLRERAGLARKDVAAALGRGETWVAEIERGSRELPTAEVGRWAEIFDVTAEEVQRAWDRSRAARLARLQARK